ncbi:MAG: ABC transporter permease [Nitrospira sp.]|nr:ABC transporter permease [Nitrospira sp.]
MQAIAVIALNTFRENLRDKILYNLVFFAVLLIGLSVLLADLTIMEHHRMIKDLGLAAINLVGVIIAIFVGIGLVNKEIERRTVYTIMARPISRTTFILGKYCGLGLTLLINVLVMLSVFLAILGLYGVPITWTLFQAVQLVFVEMLLITALALLFSTFSSSTLSAIFTLAFYVIGHLIGDLKGLMENSQTVVLRRAVAGLYYLCPNLEMLNIKGQAAIGVAVPVTYQTLASAYGLSYAVASIVLACMVFQRRDF